MNNNYIDDNQVVNQWNVTEEKIEELARIHFPYETPNPGQLEAIVNIVKDFLIDNRRHVILEAPTGVGKSAIAVTIHRVMKAINNNHRTQITTATKGLQDQYVGDFRDDILDLKGKTNYECPHNVGPYNSSGCRRYQAMKVCDKKTQCPYYIQRVEWCNRAELRSTNNSFSIEACPALVMLPENKANLMICDESHELDDHIIEHTALSFQMKDFTDLAKYGRLSLITKLSNIIKEFGKIGKGVPFHPDENIISVVSVCLEEINEYLNLLGEKKGISDEENTLLENLQSIQDKFSLFKTLADSGEWLLQEYETNTSVKLKSVYAHTVSEYGLFRKCDIFLHMSATICGFEEYARSLGLENYSTVTIENPIPIENRRIIVLPKFSLHRYFNDWEKYFKFIHAILMKHKDERGLIHSVSFDLANKIIDSLPSELARRAIVSNKRYEIMDHMKHNHNGIVISPSIEKGYDFKGDLSRFQIIAKVPFGFLGDPHIKLNTERSSEWYARKTILRIVQASGRAVRGPTDYAKTYVIDAQILKLIANNSELFPEYYLDAIEILE